MKHLLLKNLVILLFLLILLNFFLEFLNYFYGGYPPYDKFKLTRTQLMLVKSEKDSKKELDFDFSKFKTRKVKNFKNFKENYSINVCGRRDNGRYNLAYIIDKNGFRENDEKNYIFSNIVLLGDSLTLGECVYAPNDIASQLKLLTDKKILNLGISGSSPKTQLKALKKYTKDTDFETLVWIFYEGNDYLNENLNNQNIINEHILNLSPLHTWKIENSKFDLVIINRKKWYEDETSFISYFNIKLKIFFAEKIKGFTTLTNHFRNYENLLDNEDYSIILKNTNNYLNQKNIKRKLIYYLPSYERLSLFKAKKNKKYLQLEKLRINVKKIAEENSFIFIDGTKKFDNLRNRFIVFNYNLPTHLNEIGYKLVANNIYEELKDY